MKLDPQKNWIIGKAVIFKPTERIIAPGAEKGISRVYIVTAVSREAEAQGYKIGDVILAQKVWDIKLTGFSVIQTFSTEDIICRVLEVPLTSFVDLDGKPVAEDAAAAAVESGAAA